MATADQIAAFSSQWLPYATQAGNALGVAPSTILAQWAAESGYGTNTGAANNNVGGIMNAGTQTQAAYSSAAAFTDAYINTIEANFPGAENTGSNVNSFVSGLSNSSGQSYYGAGSNAQAYDTLLAGTLATLTGSSTPGTTTAGSPATTRNVAAVGTSATSSGCSGMSGLFTWSCWTGVATDAAFVALGVIVLVIAVVAGVFSTKTGKTFLNVVKSGAAE